MGIIKNLYYLLEIKDRKKVAKIIAFMIFVAITETLGVASVIPFLAILANPEVVYQNEYLFLVFTTLSSLGLNTIRSFLILLGLSIILVLMVSFTLRSLSHYKMIQFIEGFRYYLSSKILNSYLQQDYIFFIDRHSSDLTKTVISEVDQLIASLIRPILIMVANFFLAIFILTMLVIVDPLIAIFSSISFLGLYLLIYLFFKRKLIAIGIQRLKFNGTRFKAVGEAFGGIKPIKMIESEDLYVKNFHIPSEGFAKTQISYELFSVIPSFLIELMIYISVIIASVIMVIFSDIESQSTLSKHIPIVGLFLFSILKIKPAFQSIYAGVTSLRFGSPAIENIFKDLKSLKKHRRFNEDKKVNPSLFFNKTVSLINISFKYPNANCLAIEDFNFEFEIGSKIGIVGFTGAGKTTLIDIFLGLLKPTVGRIEVDGVPLSNKNLGSWKKMIGYVPQDIFISDITVAENIAFGINKDEINIDKVMECADIAQIHDFIVNTMPLGYQSYLGERGVKMSGGERQRLGLARALYSNPQILFLDEATSALDNLTEQKIINQINLMSPKKTIIAVAHRLSTLQSFDKILLIRSGKLEASGSYQELLNNNEYFKQLAIANKPND